MPSDLERAALRFRADLLRQERQAASEMVRAYAAAWQRVRAQVDALQAQIDAARSVGLVADVFRARLPGGPVIPRTPGTFSPSWIWEQDRLGSLRRQIEAELRQFAAQAGEIVEAGQLRAVEAAQAGSEALVGVAAREVGEVEIAGMFNRLPREAIQDLVGFASDGSPLRSLFAEIAPGVSHGMTDALVAALATGTGPRETARLMRRQFGMGLARALTIARTEHVRAYREATRRNYEANSDILSGWIWLSACDRRSCPSCFAMHGTKHKVTETLDDHPNGRCVMLPDIKGRERKIESGEKRLRALTETDQQRVLGKAGHAAWKAGAVQLSDFVGRKDDPRSRWGTMRYAKSLRQILGKEEAGKWIGRVLQAAQERAKTSPRKSPHYRVLQDTRLREVRAMPAADLRRLGQEMSSAAELPKLKEHFRKHGMEFSELGVGSAEEFGALFLEHVQRKDLRVFTYVSTQQATQYRHWVLMGMDNGVMVVYNESKKQAWSMLRVLDIGEYLRHQAGWWVEVTDLSGRAKVRRV